MSRPHSLLLLSGHPDTVTSPPPPTPTGNEPVIPARKLLGGFGAQTFPTFAASTYGAGGLASIRHYMTALAEAGFSYVRAPFTSGHAGAINTRTVCLELGMKWLMVVVPESHTKPTDQTIADTEAKVRAISRDYADVVLAIEGVNEPNHNRSQTQSDGSVVSATVPSDWASNATYGAYPHQEAIWRVAKETGSNIADVPIIGPSLHDIAADASYTLTEAEMANRGGTRHFHQLLDLGILSVQDMSGMHTYPSRGNIPMTGFTKRVDRLWSAYGAGYDVWPTEWGYTNAVANTTSGHAIATEKAAAIYGPRGLLNFARGYDQPPGARVFMPLTYFETLDDIDTGAKEAVESNFGMIRCGSTTDRATWSEKPILPAFKAMFGDLKEPAVTTDYTIPNTALTIDRGANTRVRHAVVGKQDGTLYLYLWNEVSVMDTATKADIDPAPVLVSFTDGTGIARDVFVDANVSRYEIARA